MKIFKKKLKLKPRAIIKEITLITLNVFVMIATFIAISFAYAYSKTPLATDLSSRNIPQTSIIYDRTGEHILYEIHGEENRKILTHEEIPDTMRIATIAAEDDAFYSHYGIDPISMLRALKSNIESKELSQGASTITQQLARNAFLSRDKTFRRKLLEIVLAVKIERAYTKEQILDMYLNEIPYGSNAYGIETAAEIFFRKKAKDLTLDEAALIAALPKATSYYSPYGENMDELLQRQRKIINRVEKLKLADAKTISLAKQEDIATKITPVQNLIDAPHFVFYVKEELEKKFGTKAVEEGGLRVYTTLDYDLQKLGEQSIAENESLLKRYGASNAALVSLSPKTGEIFAMVGSRNYFDDSIDGQVNVTIRPRQPGSSFKPFAYATAFEKGFQPETKILDAQTDFGADGSGRHYIPRNYDGKFHGVVTMRQALAMSLNVPAVKTLSMVGVKETIEMAHRLGITTLQDTNRYGLSLVLGGGEVKLLDETAGYSVFANDGKKNTPTALMKVTDPAGKELYVHHPENAQVINPQVARKVASILSDNDARVPIFGPRNKLFIPGKIVAAKTGTTSEFKDAWTVGFSPYIATGVWAGNNNSFPMRGGADGSYVAAPIWNKFMSQALNNYPVESFIAYEKESEKKIAGASTSKQIISKVTYYKNGKKISEKKAKKADPKKVEIRIEYVTDGEVVK